MLLFDKRVEVFGDDCRKLLAVMVRNWFSREKMRPRDSWYLLRA